MKATRVLWVFAALLTVLSMASPSLASTSESPTTPALESVAPSSPSAGADRYLLETQPFLTTMVRIAEECIVNPNCGVTLAAGTPCDTLHPVCICRKIQGVWSCARP